MERVGVPGGELEYERSGSQGDPLVLVHDGWDDHGTWDRVVPGLAESLQVLTYDRRGHGASSAPAGERPIAANARDLGDLLEATGLYPAHLHGHGLGGAIVLRLAAERPELVRSASLHEPPFVDLLGGRSPEGPVLQGRDGRLSELAARARTGDTEAAAQGFLAAFGSPGERWDRQGPEDRRRLRANAAAWALEITDPEATRPPLAEVAALALPVLATCGELSPLGAAGVVRALGADLPNATVRVLTGVGYAPQRSDPDVVVGVLGTFLLERNVPTT